MKGEREWVEMLAENALQVLHDAGLSVTLHIYDGNPRMILVREAEKWGADSVFIGANSFQVEPEFYPLGCVASAIAARANCSVEVVRIGNNPPVADLWVSRMRFDVHAKNETCLK